MALGDGGVLHISEGLQVASDATCRPALSILHDIGRWENSSTCSEVYKLHLHACAVNTPAKVLRGWQGKVSKVGRQRRWGADRPRKCTDVHITPHKKAYGRDRAGRGLRKRTERNNKSGAVVRKRRIICLVFCSVFRLVGAAFFFRFVPPLLLPPRRAAGSYNAAASPIMEFVECANTPMR